jgi:hypothetical protein
MNDNTEQAGPKVRIEYLICGRDYVEKYLDSSTINPYPANMEKMVSS